MSLQCRTQNWPTEGRYDFLGHRHPAFDLKTPDDIWAWIAQARHRMPNNFQAEIVVDSLEFTSPCCRRGKMNIAVPVWTGGWRQLRQGMAGESFRPIFVSKGLLSMGSDSLLCDSIVSAFGQLLNAHLGIRGANIMCLDGNAWRNISDGSFPDQEVSTSLTLRRLQYFYPSMKSISELRAVLIPWFHEPAPGSLVGHWTGVAVFPLSKQIVYTDSFHGPPPSDLLAKLKLFLSHVGLGTHYPMLECVAEDRTFSPPQQNGHDCGLFMFLNMISVARHRALGMPLISHGSEDLCLELRKVIAFALLTAQSLPAWLIPALAVTSAAAKSVTGPPSSTETPNGGKCIALNAPPPPPFPLPAPAAHHLISAYYQHVLSCRRKFLIYR